MPNARPAAPPFAIVVRWPQSVPAATAERLRRHLFEAGLAATWAIEAPDQAEALAAASGCRGEVEAALLLTSPLEGLAEAIERGIERFNTACQSVDAIHVGRTLPRGHFERRLCQAGIRGIISAPVSAMSSSVRPLPFGVWEFGPHLTAPTATSWPWQRLCRRSILAEAAAHSPAMAHIDLERAASTKSRGWREVERLVQQASDLCCTRALRAVTISQLAAELSAASAARPQRSILRMAA
jgi:hypothetical protein